VENMLLGYDVVIFFLNFAKKQLSLISIIKEFKIFLLYKGNKKINFISKRELKKFQDID